MLQWELLSHVGTSEMLPTATPLSLSQSGSQAEDWPEHGCNGSVSFASGSGRETSVVQVMLQSSQCRSSWVTLRLKLPIRPAPLLPSPAPSLPKVSPENTPSVITGTGVLISELASREADLRQRLRHGPKNHSVRMGSWSWFTPCWQWGHCLLG